jgi:hypothetical protein
LGLAITIELSSFRPGCGHAGARCFGALRCWIEQEMCQGGNLKINKHIS